MTLEVEGWSDLGENVAEMYDQRTWQKIWHIQGVKKTWTILIFNNSRLVWARNIIKPNVSWWRSKSFHFLGHPVAHFCWITNSFESFNKIRIFNQLLIQSNLNKDQKAGNVYGSKVKILQYMTIWRALRL